ncbi:MAG: hypothetical protein KGR48_01555 [Alphaproteobacteria bacterium]|nr:hypothetical protein [Alphaproteobacteria bacterium]
MIRRFGLLPGVALLVALLAPASALACACGCGVFDVGTGSVLMGGTGGLAFLEYDFMNQNRNWSGTSPAPSSANADKEIRTDFVTLGGAYMFNTDWGVMAELPFWNRTFRTDDGSGVQAFHHAAFGDMRLMAIYGGLSDDLSTQLEAGVKLPTGDFTYANFDRDTEIGTGSTDLMLGLNHRGALDPDYKWMWFGQVMWDQPLATQGGYRPGAEVDGALGAYYAFQDIPSGVAAVPMLQVIASHRAHDGGPLGDPANTGYDRLMISPGVEVDAGSWKLYGDVEFPVYQDMTGNQLVAPELFKVILSHAL